MLKCSKILIKFFHRSLNFALLIFAVLSFRGPLISRFLKKVAKIAKNRSRENK